MPSSVRDFWSTLVRLRLIDAATAEQFARQLAASMGAAADDPVKVAKSLIAQNWLTKFQAKRLLADRGDELVQGDYLVLDRVETVPLSRWYRARRFDSPAEVLIYPCSAAADSRSPVDLAWLQPHLAVVAAGLQTIHVAETAPANPMLGTAWRGLAITELPAGKSLAQWVAATGPIGFANAVALGGVVGGALAAMHSAGLFHGGLRPGRVWVADDSSVYLLRTAGGPPVFPGAVVQPPYDWYDDDGQSPAFSAPEWLTGQTHADARSDIYSLGGLIYHVATGRTVSPGELPADITQAVASGAIGDPVLRVLGAALALNPNERFQDVASFLNALSAVQSLLASQAAPVVEAQPLVESQPVATAQPVAEQTKVAEAIAVEPTIVPAEKPVADVPLKPQRKPEAEPRKPAEAAEAARPDTKPRPTAKTAQPLPLARADSPSKSASPSSSQSGSPAPAKKVVAVKPQAEKASASRPAAAPSDSPVTTETPIAPVAAAAPVTEVAPLAEATPVAEVAPVAAAAPVAEASQATPQAAAPKSKPAAENANSEKATPKSAAAPEPPPRKVRKRNRRNRRGPIIVGSSAVAVLLLLLAIVLRSTGDNTPPERPRPTPRPVAVVSPAPADRGPAASNVASTETAPTTSGGFEVVRDDKTLWIPPWPADSAAPPLDLVVPGAQAILSVRPSSLLRDGSQADWLAWFGQDLEPALQSLSKRAGVEVKAIDRLVIGMIGGVDGEPTASMAVWLTQPTDLKSLRQKWGVSASKTPNGETIFAGDEPESDAYFIAGDAITDATVVSSFAFGSLDTVRLIAENGGGAIPLSRPLQTAWDQTSDSADFVAMVVPNFLFADGRKMLQRFAPRSIEPLKNLLIPNVTAAVLTIDTREHWYGEVKLLPGGGTTAAGLARAMQERIVELPGLAESFVVDSDISPSWRAMAIRLPQYLRAVNEQSRYGVSATLATANFYLPAAAAPQVTLASLLALSTTPQVAVAVAPTTTPVALTIEQMLDSNLSISFEQESLEFAVAMIGDEFSTGLPEGSPRPKITIVGGDLEKSGITQNQQVRDFKMRDVPLREALTRLVAGANPDKTVTSVTEDKQSLVWVVDPASTDQNPSLLITTRPQAAVKGYKLPKEFVAQ